MTENIIDKSLNKVYDYVESNVNLNKRFDIGKNEEILKYNEDIKEKDVYIKHINNGFILITILMFCLLVYIGFSAYELNYSCDTFIYYSYVYVIFGILIYSFFILFIIKFVSLTKTYKNFKYYYDNYYIIYIIVILGLFYLLGSLFKENEHKVLVSHLIWLSILFLTSVLFLPFYINFNNTRTLISVVIKQIIIVLLVMIILYMYNFKVDYVEDYKFIILLTIMLVIISDRSSQFIVKNDFKVTNIKLIVGYIMLCWFTYNILSNTNSIVKNTQKHCNDALEICKYTDKPICKYYPNYCKLSVEGILSNIDIVKQKIKIDLK